MLQRDLVFTETWSIENFKRNQGVTEIEIKQNPKTGKLFFDFKFGSGACSKRAESGTMDSCALFLIVYNFFFSIMMGNFKDCKKIEKIYQVIALKLQSM